MKATTCFVALFAELSFAHSVMSGLKIDGTLYPAYQPVIDSQLAGVKRIQWGYKNYWVPNSPIQDVTDPGLACMCLPDRIAQMMLTDVRPAGSYSTSIEAVARAGASVTASWTPILRMHVGPVMAYMAKLPEPDANPNALEWFKIYEEGFDKTTGKWANIKAVEANNTFTFQIPCDIAPGAYVLRPELLSLHGNEPFFQILRFATGVQHYMSCFNVDVVGNGTVNPPGVRFPGAYSPTEIGITFSPSYGDDNAKNTAYNSKYVPPGPPLYKGRFDAPRGPVPVVNETGIYQNKAIQAKYETLMERSMNRGMSVYDVVNTGWTERTATPQRIMEFWMPFSGKFWTSIGSSMMATNKDVAEFKEELKKAGIQ